MKLEINHDGEEFWHLSAGKPLVDMGDPDVVGNVRKRWNLLRRFDDLKANPPTDPLTLMSVGEELKSDILDLNKEVDVLILRACVYPKRRLR